MKSMMDYQPEGHGVRADSLTSEQILAAAQNGTILESTALAFDHNHRLRFEFLGKTFYMPYEECAEGVGDPDFRDVAILTRVGRSTCFVLKASEEADGGFILSRRSAQQKCHSAYLDSLQPGDILPCCVTHLEPFGAFCDVGCGISALLPIDCLSVSRIQHPSDRVSVGQRIYCAVKSRDAQGRLVLTLKELMGTWQQNADCFEAGETVVGIVRSVESYGVFIEIAPNLAGLAECTCELHAGQPVSVYIKSILPDRMKVKLAVVNHELEEPAFFGPRYFVKQSHLDRWDYSPIGCAKQISTCFDVPASPL